MPIQYVNTDLDVSATLDLTPVVQEFQVRGVFSLHDDLRTETGWFAIFETEKTYPDPESNIVALLEVIEAASHQVMSIWQSCVQREFNIGYECGDEPWAFNQGISTSTLQRMANVGATLTITIYPPDRELG